MTCTGRRRQLRSVAWRFYLIAAVGVGVAYFALPPAQAKLVAWPVIGWSSVTAMLIGVRLHRPDAERAWYLLIAGVATFVIGDNLYSFTNYVKHDVITFPSFVDPVYLAMYPLLFAGLLLLARKRTPGRDVASLLDASIITGGAGLVFWVLLIVPYFRDQDMLPLARATAIAYPLGDMALLAVAIRLAVASGRRPPAFWLLAGSVVPLLIADALYGFLNLTGTWHEHHPVDVGWIAFYVGWGVAALHPSMHELSVRSTATPRVSPRRLAIVGSAAMIPPAVLFIQQSTGPITDGYAIALTGAVLFALVLVRTNGVAREVADKRNEARFQALFDNSSDAVVVVDIIGRVNYLTPSTERVLGLKPGALLHQPIGRFLAPDDERELSVLLSSPGGTTTAEWQVSAADGTVRDLEVVTADLRGDPRIDGVVLTMRDISERKRLDAELRRQALHDTLTRLPNKSLFDDRVAHALGRADRSHSEVAVLFLDLDNFKLVNDSLGHSAGDELLKAVAARLLSVLKAGDTVARFGGDEFVILMDNVEDAAQSQDLAERIIASLNRPVPAEGRELLVTVSIGIAVSQPGMDRANDLLRHADLALLRAKTRGRARYETFRAYGSGNAVDLLFLETDLWRAIERQELKLFYQPEFSVESGQLLGFEALLRWDHPTRGMLLPSAFVNLAEESGSLVAIGLWVIEEACRQLQRWEELSARQFPLEMSVNLSVRQLEEPDFAKRVATILATTGTDPAALRLEITESILVGDDGEALAVLAELKSLGVRLAIDDFGTGYSSFSYLKTLPVDSVKIDQSFISGLELDDSNLLIVQGIITMAHDLGLVVTAEGIETAEQLAVLQRVQCDRAQGFLLARPQPSELLDTMMSGRSRASAREVA